VTCHVKSKEDILADIFQEIFLLILERVQTDVSPDLLKLLCLFHLFQ
jgi:hypothetical protein